MTTTGQPDLSKLAGPSGALMMVAIDQRESLRAMFAAGRLAGPAPARTPGNGPCPRLSLPGRSR